MHNFLIMLMMFSPPQINHCCDFKNNIQSRNQNIKYWMTKHSPNVTIYKKWNWLKKKLAKVCIWFIFVKTHCFNDKRKNASSLRGSHVKLSCLPQMHWRQVLFFFFFSLDLALIVLLIVLTCPSLSLAINEVICYICSYIYFFLAVLQW